MPSVTNRDELDDALCQGIIDVSQAACVSTIGDADNAWSINGLFGFFIPSAQQLHFMAVALADKVVIGSAMVDAPLLDNLNTAEIFIEVHPDHRRLGIGSALLAWAETIAADQGRHVFHTWFTSRPPTSDTPMVTAPTGDSMPADSPGGLFSSKHGYSLEQVERDALLTLPIATRQLEAWQAEAQPKAAGYRLHSWPAPIPDQWVDDYAQLRGEAPTSAPTAGVVIEDEKWDAARIREEWSREVLTGNHSLITVAEHIDSGRLVAFTEIETADAKPEVAYQCYTYVQPDHRGHRLGLLTKATNLAQLMDFAPAVKRLYTDNATENSHMLAINQIMGFGLRSFTGYSEKKINTTS